MSKATSTMECESSSFNIIGDNKDSGMSNFFESHGTFASQSSLSQSPNGEAHFMNLFEQPSGLLDLIRFGCTVTGHPLSETSLLDFLQGVNMPGGHNWDVTGINMKSASSDMTEGRSQLVYCPPIAGYGEVPCLVGKDLEKKPKGRAGSVLPFKMSVLPTVPGCKASGENDKDSRNLMKKLLFSLLQQGGDRILTEREPCEDPVCFGLPTAGNQSPLNPYLQFCVAMDILNGHFCPPVEGVCLEVEGPNPFDVRHNLITKFEDLLRESYGHQIGGQSENHCLRKQSIGADSLVGSFEGGGGFNKGLQSRELDEAMRFSSCHEVLVGEEDRKQDILDHVASAHQAESPQISAGAVPEGLIFVLRYLKLKELLAMEQVSKSLRDSVRNDTSLWTCIRLEQPLSKKIRDDVLVMLCARAQGHLQSLYLPKCARITDAGVQEVLATNPTISKLSLPGCVGISAEAFVEMVEAHMKGKSLSGTGLRHLRIQGLSGVTKEHVEKLQSMLYDGGRFNPGTMKPQYYHYGKNSDLSDNDRLLDVEACPICGNAKIVYDCTRERCQQKHQQCRGCTFCISRCEACGVCIDESEYEETFCLDLLCSSCWLRPVKCLHCDRPEGGAHAEHFPGGPGTFFICSDCQSLSSEQGSPRFYFP